VSTLHHQFRALTAISPLQYQKQLRLQAARQRVRGGAKIDHVTPRERRDVAE